jgi:hypothetical protein
MSVRHTYSTGEDTANGRVDSSSLEREIKGAELAAGVPTEISTTADELTITFKQQLKRKDRKALTAVVGAHAAVSLTGRIQQSRSEVTDATQEGTYQAKLEVTFEPVTEGLYQLTWYSEHRSKGAHGDWCQVRMRLNGTNVGETLTAEPAWTNASGSLLRRFAAGDEPAFDIMFRRRGSAGDTAEIRRARIYLIPLNE